MTKWHEHFSKHLTRKTTLCDDVDFCDFRHLFLLKLSFLKNEPISGNIKEMLSSKKQ